MTSRKIRLYQRGVRQGCILSLLLFNLFINELPLSFNQSPQYDPFTLPNGTKLNCLHYADDSVILSRSKQGLQNSLQKLEIFNSKWLLEVNHKKNMIFHDFSHPVLTSRPLQLLSASLPCSPSLECQPMSTQIVGILHEPRATSFPERQRGRYKPHPEL